MRPLRWRTHRRTVRWATLMVLLALLAGSGYLLRSNTPSHTVIGYFSSSVGLYPGDDLTVAGVPVGTVTAIEPGPQSTKVTMSIRGDVDVPADARAIIVAPNLVSARFIELAPMYVGGPKLANGAVIGPDHTAVPVEWDEVKDQLTQLSAQLGPQPGSLQGPLAAFVNQAADTFDGNGESFRQAVRELSQTAGRLGDSRSDLLGTVKNLHTVIDALSASNEQIVKFSSHVASLSQVLAESSTDLDDSLGALNQALTDIRGFLKDNNDALTGQVDKLAAFTQLLTDHSDDIEQVLHVAPNGLANFYNMYNPAQASIAGILTVPELANPVQFICGTFDAGATPDYFKRAEICRQRMGPVLRRIAMNYPPILFHPINSITAYKGQTIYDTPETQAKAQTPVSQLQWQPLPGVTPPAIPPDADLSTILLPPAAQTPPPAASAPGGQGVGRSGADPNPGDAPPAPPPAAPSTPAPPVATEGGS